MSLRYRTVLSAVLTGSVVMVPVGEAAGATVASSGLLPAHPSGPRCDVALAPRLPVGTYPAVFSPGPPVPYLSGWTPQGLTTWHNWDGQGHTALLLGMYRRGAQSYLVGIDPQTGARLGTVRTRASHLGALGVVGRWVIAQDTLNGHQKAAVRRYPVSAMRAAMLTSQRTGTKPYLAPTGTPQRVHSVGFMAVTGKSMWLGRHSKARTTKMYRYRATHSGLLHRTGGPWRVPPRTQGLLVTKDQFVFTSSYGGQDGTLTVVNRVAPNTPVACVSTPALPENMTIDGDKVYASYESGAKQFDKPSTTSKVSDLRTGLLRSLLSWGAGTGGLGGQALAQISALNVVL
ncbi:MAG TPA: hypothetical protein VGJ14_05065 [Sporichthyaceae bacterium]|jgi:hypothetical protein